MMTPESLPSSSFHCNEVLVALFALSGYKIEISLISRLNKTGVISGRSNLYVLYGYTYTSNPQIHLK